MEEKGIIRKVDEHSNWCSNVCFVTKKDGSLRVCLDPKRLNENLKRCPHKIPTVEELNPAFHGAKYFSKLDAKAGYWSVKLAEKSQLLTTFRSPLGQRYCFLHMPFGLNTAQDDFHTLWGDKVSVLTHTYPHKPWRDIEVTICKITRLTAHVMCGLMSDLLICTCL